MHTTDFERIGKRLVAEHLIGGNFGNMSIRKGKEGFFIKRSRTYLDNPGELVYVPMEGKVPKEASSEYRVHRAVYTTSPFMAVVHAHPPHAVALSLVCDEIIPQDSGGEMFCPIIPVVQGSPGTEGLASSVAEGLAHAPVVIARGHGTFAAGKTLDEAYTFTSLAEHSCRVLALIEQFRK
jgi:L-fuculose-phosphate aldolase